MDDPAADFRSDPLGDGITLIDIGLERPGFGACYLIESNGEAALFDTGTRHSVPRVLAALASRGLEPQAVRWVIASHVHLDHAGGAGALLDVLPSATVLAHPRGVRHLLDPSALQASAEQVYGVDVVAATYGHIVPVPAHRMRALADDECIDLAGRRLRFMDSPGHARHHVTMWDESSASWFTGDCFGISYRDFDGGDRPFIFPTTSPIQFDPEPLKQTIGRMLRRAPRAMLLTHYGKVENAVESGAALTRLIDAQVALGRRCAGSGETVAELTEAIQQLLWSEVEQLGVEVDQATARRLLAIDAELNAKGTLFWLSQVTARDA